MLIKTIAMNGCYKMIGCLLFCFVVNKGFAQNQSKDSLPEYMKQFRYFKLPGMPDSATYFKRMDSSMQRQRLRDSLQQRYDSLMRQRKVIPSRTSTAYNNINNKAALLSGLLIHQPKSFYFLIDISSPK